MIAAGAVLSGIWSSPLVRNLLIAAAILGGFFVWHVADKAAAVREAKRGLVAKAELTAALVQLEEIRRRQAVADAARRHLNAEIERATAEAEAAEQELEHYVSTVEDSCALRPDLFDRLRNP